MLANRGAEQDAFLPCNTSAPCKRLAFYGAAEGDALSPEVDRKHRGKHRPSRTTSEVVKLEPFLATTTATTTTITTSTTTSTITTTTAAYYRRLHRYPQALPRRPIDGHLLAVSGCLSAVIASDIFAASTVTPGSFSLRLSW